MSSNISINNAQSVVVHAATQPVKPPDPAVKDLREAVQLAIAPPPVLHAPASVDAAAAAASLKAAIEEINATLKDGGRGLSFVLDPSFTEPIVKVTRTDTGEVIRQFPNEAVVKFAKNIEKLKGVLFHGLI